MTLRFSGAFHWCWPVILILACCRAESGKREMTTAARQPTSPSQQAGPRQSNDPLFTGILRGNSGAERAWQTFIHDGRYRIASSDDFRIPEWAIKLHGGDLQAQMSNPIVAGVDINHDGASYDFAAIVVNVFRTDAKRFGVVIFNAPKGSDRRYDQHWLLLDQDLSNDTLSRASSWTLLTTYHEDGTETVCSVIWDKKKRVYSCAKVPSR